MYIFKTFTRVVTDKLGTFIFISSESATLQSIVDI